MSKAIGSLGGFERLDAMTDAVDGVEPENRSLYGVDGPGGRRYFWEQGGEGMRSCN